MTAAAGAGGSAGVPRQRPARQAARRPGAVVIRPQRAIDDMLPDEFTGTKSESPMELAVSRLKENRLAQVAGLILAIIIVTAFMAPLFEKGWAHRTASETALSSKDKVMIGGEKKEVVDLRGMPQVGPGLRTSYTMGADQLGRDVFMRVLQGGKVSLEVGFGAAIITMVLAMIFGTMAGFYKGRADTIISRVFDIMLSTPSIILAIALSTSLASTGGIWFIKRGSILLPMLIIGILGGPYLGRIVRSQALALSEREFVEAARALGASNKRIMLNEMLPHLTTVLITYFGILVSANISAEAGLSFLGVGVLPPTPSWGNIIADGRIFYSTAPWIAFFPGVMIMLTVLCLNLVGEALEEAFEPKGGR